VTDVAIGDIGFLIANDSSQWLAHLVFVQPDGVTVGPAACGFMPKNGWYFHPESPNAKADWQPRVTCQRCVRKIQRLFKRP
jgi:hypothetical protein